MEVLAARYRLGETLWPFTTNAGIWVAAKKLVKRGWIWTENGQVERTFRAGLTEEGKRVWEMNKPYNPPLPLPSSRKDCYEHPEVGPAYACARCRTGRRDACILKEV